MIRTDCWPRSPARAAAIGRARPDMARQADQVRDVRAGRQLDRRARSHHRRQAEGPASGSRSSSRTSPPRAARSRSARRRSAAPDGYTMVLAFNGPLSITPLLSKVPYDVQKDLAPVITTTSQPNVLAVNAKVPAKDVQGAGRVREGQSGQAQLRVGRPRQLVASQRRAAEVARRRRHRAHPVQRLAAGRDVDGAGRDADDLRRDAAAAAADPGGQAARARRDVGEALPAAAGPADDRRERLSELRVARVERRARAGRHAEADRCATQRRDQRDPEAAGRRAEAQRRRASISSAARRRSSAR